MSNKIISFPISRTRRPWQQPPMDRMLAPRVVYNWRAKIYHKPECRYATDNYLHVPIKRAEKFGARPCRVCCSG